MWSTAWVGVLAFLVDRISKQLIYGWQKTQTIKSMTVWPGVLDFTYTENTGMAFSILADRTWLLILLSIVALVLMVIALWGALQKTPMQNALLWLLLAGGLGNLLDRIYYSFVIDFIHVRFFQFPIFNIADISLTVSAVFLIIALLRNPKESVDEQKKAKAA